MEFRNNTGALNSSVNLAARNQSRGNGSPSRGGRGGGRGGDRGGRGASGRGNGGRGRDSSFQQGVFCQICGKEGHGAERCFKRFNRDYNYNSPPQKSVSSATNSYGVDTNWYMDSGATDHITGDLEKLTTRDRYHGGDQVHAANGSGMEIDHIGHSILHSPAGKIHLQNILHVPKAKKKSSISKSFITR